MLRVTAVLVMCLLAALSVLVPVLPVGAAKISDVRNTKHNLSATPFTPPLTDPRTVKATSETQICVFCHTPHGAESIPGAPLWNRKLSTATYTTYTSSSIEANAAELAAGPGGSSRLCLSCHDGTLAIGQVNVLNGSGSPPVVAGLTGSMPAGSATTGFTRNLGVNLSNDHPISFTYDGALATADGELRTPDGTLVGTRSPGVKPKLPLEAGQMQCSTCHDPHLREADTTKGPAKFLRLNRFQESGTPVGGAFSEANDIICLACHNKGGQAWAQSAHAVATQPYGTSTISTLREFPTNLPVWQASCLNCHDTHTVQGARRLLREGTDSTANPKTGGNSAIEQTCYQCHQLRTNTASSTPPMVLNLVTQTVPNIMTDFTAAGSYHMPITTSEQCAGSEKHSIGDTVTDGTARALDGKDFVERPALLGAGGGNGCNRHVECTDCHNPHRVQKGNHAGGQGGTDIRGTANGNNVSNALLGGFGVEPVYPTGVANTRFGSIPTSFSLRCGSGAGSSNCTQVVTNEYQICLKCHSNYAYTDTDDPVGDATATMYNFSGRPTIGQDGTTPAALAAFLGANNVNVWPSGSKYTNQAMEFWGPASHKGEANSSGTEPSHGFTGAYASPNHRSWHPVMTSTGRTSSERGNASNFVAPWQTNLGTQTMYCTDCHGNTTTNTNNTPNTDKPWGPHGSTSPFILKGTYDKNSRVGDAATTVLCLKCHTPNTGTSGFCCGGKGNLHAYHLEKMNGGSNRYPYCTNCHVAVPHGWKHKALLADTRTVGNEVGLTTETNVAFANTQGYTKGPYYLNAMLKVTTWKRSGNWASSDCNGGVGGMKSACQNQ
jgi:hypothetical protein